MLKSKITNLYESKKVTVYDREEFEREARMAVILIERWGMIAATPDGEDSAGRQRLRLQTPDELVDRAFTVAALTFKKARDKGFVHLSPELPEPEEYLPPHARIYTPNVKQEHDTSTINF